VKQVDFFSESKPIPSSKPIEMGSLDIIIFFFLKPFTYIEVRTELFVEDHEFYRCFFMAHTNKLAAKLEKRLN
jgi:hypothetical protein